MIEFYQVIESVRIIRFVIFGCILAGASLNDLKRMKIPNRLMAAGAAVSLLRLAEGTALVQVLAGLVPAAGILITVLVLRAFTGRSMMGAGDIKLIGVIGLHLGTTQTLIATAAACALGILLYPVIKGKGFPFAPMLFAGTVLAGIIGIYTVNYLV